MHSDLSAMHILCDIFKSVEMQVIYVHKMFGY